MLVSCVSVGKLPYLVSRGRLGPVRSVRSASRHKGTVAMRVVGVEGGCAQGLQRGSGGVVLAIVAVAALSQR